MNEKIVADAYAWVEYLDGTKKGEKLRELLNSEAETYTSTVSISEVISKAARTGRDCKIAYNIITSNSTIVNADEQLSYETGIIHAEMRREIRDFGLADAYVLATARKIGAKILTGDPHFNNVEGAVQI
jgi:predicted nucleic acid-binding protein